MGRKRRRSRRGFGRIGCRVCGFCRSIPIIIPIFKQEDFTPFTLPFVVLLPSYFSHYWSSSSPSYKST